jgi:putative flippase GtrA
MPAGHPPVRGARLGRSSEAAVAGLGGVVATLVDVATLSALVESGCAIAPAALAGASAGAVAAFWFNRHVAFRDHSPLGCRQVARAGVVALVTALAMAAAMQLTAVVLGIPYLVAKALCAVLVFTLWSLPAQRRFVFVNRLDAAASTSSLF